MLRIQLSVLLLGLALALGGVSSAQAQCMEFAIQGTIPAPSIDTFGQKHTISDDVAVVSFISLQGTSHVQIYRLSGDQWLQEAVLNGFAAGDLFGKSVAIEDDLIAITSVGGSGSFGGWVYLYRFNGVSWDLEDQIQPATVSYSDFFGVSVALSGELLAVGANAADGIVAGAGSVYIFRKSGPIWVEEQEVFASDGTEEAIFGDSIDLDGNVLVVGSAQYPHVNTQNGKAYIYTFDGSSWSETNALSLPNLGGWPSNQRFGSSVSIDQGRIAIGSRGYAINGSSLYSGFGSIFIYEHDGGSWNFEEQLQVDNPESYTRGPGLGDSVRVIGDRIVAGATSEEFQLILSVGALYIFEHDGTAWSQEQRIVNETGGLTDRLGSHLSCNDSWIFASNGGGLAGPPSGPLVPVSSEVRQYRLVPCLHNEFIRGDVDGNGTFSALADAMFLLSYQFVSGSPAPSCLDAADANDDGVVNALADGLYLLNYQFSAGSPAPAAPGHLSCGMDPTGDSIDCFVSPCP